ncbi:metal-dependent phosphohydrolase [Taklimakanibacter deserti]|uniref:metal-dependent phosphohydrolase n=1 Tax=Taklimakanibacter deserti TaxID=2267839 RepID=UPI000E65303C
MLNPATIFAEAFADHLASLYDRAYGRREPRFANTIREGASLIFERLSLSDALYHDAEHTALVTLVGQDILRGRRFKMDVSPEDWLHFTIATLAHDIGYVRGICSGDKEGAYVINERGEVFSPPAGASDASLAPYHIDRSKIAVRERFALHPIIDADRIARAIELTRFPVPEDSDHRETDTEAGLVRAADLIGQLADPFYPRKLNALFHEFEEIGCNERLGYGTPADIADKYPLFFWTKVEPFVLDALNYLALTVGGRQWIANLYCNVFEMEHKIRKMGPEGNRTRDKQKSP